VAKVGIALVVVGVALMFAAMFGGLAAVEREFGRLKHNFGLAFLRVRGIERVRLHADLIMLARLATALSRVRTT
jgi:hypothetical protein